MSASLWGLLAAMAAACCAMIREGSRRADPAEVLREARALRERGRYEEALANHRWFHEHALAIEPSLYGVRLSFALSDWVALGRRYPEATEALLEIRDADAAAVAAGYGSFGRFHDVAAIDRALGREGETIALFKAIDEAGHDLAAECYPVVEPGLMEAGEYALCGRYVRDPIARFQEIREMRERHLGLARDDVPGIARHADGVFEEETARLLMILVRNGRRDEAERVRDRALAVRDDPALREAIAAVLGEA